VAEGVEQVDQAALLTARGCDVGRGFLWARPLTVDDAWTLLASLDSKRQTTSTAFTAPQS
jgi:EAL domain-containing protein (putative c-di-GMP-specific phosphodiesterase class I)